MQNGWIPYAMRYQITFKWKWTPPTAINSCKFVIGPWNVHRSTEGCTVERAYTHTHAHSQTVSCDGIMNIRSSIYSIPPDGLISSTPSTHSTHSSHSECNSSCSNEFTRTHKTHHMNELCLTDQKSYLVEEYFTRYSETKIIMNTRDELTEQKCVEWVE